MADESARIEPLREDDTAIYAVLAAEWRR